MDQLPDFMIADDPVTSGGSSAIIHTRTPQAIIEIIEDHQVCESPFRHYTFKGEFGDEDYTLRVHHLFTQEFDTEKHHQITTVLLDNAWAWFVEYMQWQDKHEY